MRLGVGRDFFSTHLPSYTISRISTQMALRNIQYLYFLWLTKIMVLTPTSLVEATYLY